MATAERHRVGPDDRFEEHSCTSSPICPYCNHTQSDYWEVLSNDVMCGGSSEEMECDACERTFVVEAEFACGFSTKPKHCDDHPVESLRWSLYPYFREIDWDLSRGFSSPLVYKTLPPEERHWVLTSTCADCGELVSYIKLPASNTIQLRDEYLNPDFFDPDGVLKVVGRDRYVKCHCGWSGKRSDLEYIEAHIDPDGETEYDEPEDWVCPDCAESDELFEAMPPRKATPILGAVHERYDWESDADVAHRLRRALAQHEMVWGVKDA